MATRRSLYDHQLNVAVVAIGACGPVRVHDLDATRFLACSRHVPSVTSDERQHVVAPSPAAMTALVALAQADTVLVSEPADRRLIAANLRGTMPWTEDPVTAGT